MSCMYLRLKRKNKIAKVIGMQGYESFLLTPIYISMLNMRGTCRRTIRGYLGKQKQLNSNNGFLVNPDRQLLKVTITR